MTASLSHRDATFQYQSTNLVDHRRATHHPVLAHPMQGLQIQLIVALDWHKAHLRTPHCLGDGFCINVIVLVRLYVGLYILCGYQAHFMFLVAQCPAQKMSSSACLHTNQRDPQIRCELQKLSARELLAHYNFAAFVKPNHVKGGFSKINADRVNLHGTPPAYTSYTPGGRRGGPSH